MSETGLVAAVLGNAFDPGWSTKGWNPEQRIAFLRAEDIPKETPRWWACPLHYSIALPEGVDPADRAAVFARAMHEFVSSDPTRIIALSELHRSSATNYLGIVRILDLPLDHPTRQKHGATRAESAEQAAVVAQQHVDAFACAQREGIILPTIDKEAASRAWTAAVRAGVEAKKAKG